MLVNLMIHTQILSLPYSGTNKDDNKQYVGKQKNHGWEYGQGNLKSICFYFKRIDLFEKKITKLSNIYFYIIFCGLTDRLKINCLS